LQVSVDGLSHCRHVWRWHRLHRLLLDVHVSLRVVGWWLVLIMYAFVEEPSCTHCGSSVQSMSWMGKAPDGQPESGTAWRLTENSYYDEGWLASGNSRGVVGVTMTGCRSAQNSSTADQPQRTNFNLRGHRSEVQSSQLHHSYSHIVSILFISEIRMDAFCLSMHCKSWCALFSSGYVVNWIFCWLIDFSWHR